MEVIVAPSPDEVAMIAADAFESLLTGAERPVIGLATGRSPLPVYRELIERHRHGRVSFARTQVFLLDEYLGLDPDHPQLFRNVIRRELLDQLDAPEGAPAVPSCAPEDLAGAGQAYEQRISDAGGIALQLLGIGRNGHIGFNEPLSPLDSRTRVVTLSSTTRRDNAGSFDDCLDLVPRQGITQGVGTILEAGRIVLIATGEAKSSAVAEAVEGPVTAAVPASALQLHGNVTLIIDEPAAAQLEHADR